MGNPTITGGKHGWEPPALPGASLPCPASRQEPSQGTATAPGLAEGCPGDAQSQRGVLGGTLLCFGGAAWSPSCPAPLSLGHRPAGAVAGLQDTSSGDKGHIPAVPEGLAPSAYLLLPAVSPWPWGLPPSSPSRSRGCSVSWSPWSLLDISARASAMAWRTLSVSSGTSFGLRPRVSTLGRTRMVQVPGRGGKSQGCGRGSHQESDFLPSTFHPSCLSFPQRPTDTPQCQPCPLPWEFLSIPYPK